MTDAVRRSVSIPIVSNGKNVLALAEVGAKLWSKDYTYRMFFEKACDEVEEMLKAEVVRRGGSLNDYTAMLTKAIDKLKSQGLVASGNNGKAEILVKGESKKAVADKKKKKVAIS